MTSEDPEPEMSDGYNPAPYGWCHLCGEPITEPDSTWPDFCEDCRPDHKPSGGHYGPLDDMSPWQENALRYLEDGEA